MAPQIDPQQFLQYIATVDDTSIASDLERRHVVVGVQALLARLQSPREKTTQLLHVNSYLVAAVKSLVDLDLFGIWERQADGQPQTIVQLAHLTNADPILLERLLRLLQTSELLPIDSQGRYEFGKFARGLTTGRLSHSYKLHSFTTANSVIALSKYLSGNKYCNPTDSQHSPWAYHMGMPFIDYLNAHPEIFTHVNEVMKTKNMDTLPWFKTYPIDELVKPCEPQDVILVDIGGGTGYDINAVLQHLGSANVAAGQLVLQDLPKVIDEAKDLSPNIQKQPYDFFAEQPIKAARAYYLHNVLHDWSDQECEKILIRVRDAMKAGHSKLLINETIISPMSAPTACATDLSMMTVNAGAERTSEQWHQLLTTVGFRISQIYLSPAIDEGLIEAEL